jgi:hypothetical protein
MAQLAFEVLGIKRLWILSSADGLPLGYAPSDQARQIRAVCGVIFLSGFNSNGIFHHL